MWVAQAKPALSTFLNGGTKMTAYSMNSKDFYKALEDKKLIGSKCKDCGTSTIPHRPICPNCFSDQTEIIFFSGKGTLVAFTVVSVPPVAMAEAGYNAKNPYCTGIVELEEGPRISAQILNLDMSNPENIKIGSKLIMTTITRGDEQNKKTFLAFESV
jgi:uncharacterized OB-fold protein